MSLHNAFLELQKGMNQSVIGQEAVVEKLLIALLADGHVLMEGLPGVAKTRSIKTLSRLVPSEFSRIQFTPDLLPSDVSGSDIYREETGEFVFQPGPVFGNLILADEINRAPAKVQSALLEAMEERQVTVAGNSRKLPELFLVLATQNPIEQEGTYPLPEAQMDRFLLYVHVPYPPAENEVEILRLVRGEKSGKVALAENILQPEDVLAARKEVAEIEVNAAAEQYIVDLVMATRNPEKLEGEVSKWIRLGASPRGTLALDAASRAHAWLQGQSFVTPENIKAVAAACLGHRIHLSYLAEAENRSRNEVVEALIASVVAV
ncbi:AAA family ATPase [Kiritimatiellaeota bacterium B1221]|nr:AAA family ATPase [Kiritimatiellaeota bacterium B1221]